MAHDGAHALGLREIFVPSGFSPCFAGVIGDGDCSFFLLGAVIAHVEHELAVAELDNFAFVGPWCGE